MSKPKLAQALVLGALLAATNLAGLTAIAHVVVENDRRPPTQGQVGESWHQRPAPTSQQTFAGDVRRAPTEGQVGEPWHPRVHAPAPPADRDGPPRWPVASLAVLAAVLALAGGLVAKRARARVRPGLTA